MTTLKKFYFLYGDEYTVHLKHVSTFKVFYIGFKPIETPWYLKLLKPEGHLFVNFLNNRFNLFTYLEYSGSETYLSDGGYYDPSYSIGFHVERINYNFNNLLSNNIE